MTDLTETPEDSARRFAGQLVRIEKKIDAELARVRQTDDLMPARWWQFLRRQWLDGVRTARASSEQKLWSIKSAFYEEP
jgi:hypothetical protein